MLDAQHPGEANCLWLLGVALLDQDKIPESIATLEAVLSRVPDFAIRAGGSGARLPA